MRLPSSRSKIVKWALVGLLFGGLAFTYSQIYGSEEEQIIPIEETVVPHSFTLQATQFLSKKEMSLNRGQFKLHQRDIENAVIPSFSCEGVKLQPDYLLEVGKMKIPLSAYDPESKIGFVLVDYNLLGPGLYEKSSTIITSQREAVQKVLSRVEDGVELFLDDEEKFINEMFGEDPNREIEPLDDDFLYEVEPDGTIIFHSDPNDSIPDAELFRRLREMNSNISQRPRIIWSNNFTETRRKWPFFKEGYANEEMMYQFGQDIKEGVAQFQIFQEKQEYLEEVFLGFKKHIYLEELGRKSNKTYLEDWIFSAAEQLYDPLQFFGVAERVKYLGFPSTNYSAYDAINKEVLQISLYDDSEEWWEHSEALISLLQANKTPITNCKKEYYEILEFIITNYPYHKWDEHYDLINDLGNEHTISLEELKALFSISKTHGICIAPISVKDERTIYDMKVQDYDNELAEMRKKIRRTKNKKQRKEYQKELIELSNYRSKFYDEIEKEAKAESATVLKEDIEDFLSWALEISYEWGHKKRV